MLDHLWHLIVGSPLPTQSLSRERLNKIRALAAFSPDALSSIAYANQEIYLGLALAGSAGLAFLWPIGLAITGLLLIVALSYFQTIHGYPSGGGSYVVARENLGTIPGLIAAAALIVDYILTAAVSLTAGVAALASAFPVLWAYKVELAIVLLIVITVVNLRGLQESGTVMAIPVYLFLGVFLSMLGVGVIHLMVGGVRYVPQATLPVLQPITPFLVLHTFATGCTALTGIEAISNGVPAFRPPEARNAGKTLIIMAGLMGTLFLGSIGLTQFLAVIPRADETILSALAHWIFGNTPLYFLVQISTLLILAVAANTSFAGFPRLAAILAKDGFLPHQLAGLGDRLVYSNGILTLAAITGLLIILFNGNTHALIPLFAVGAFLAFTLSQIGMVNHWQRTRGRHWKIKAFLNGLGGLTTGITMVIVGVSKFVEGAWIVPIAIALMTLGFLRIRDHYQDVAQELSLSELLELPALTPPHPRIVIPISGIHKGIVNAITFARAISTEITAVYVELEPGSGEQIQQKWTTLWPNVPLVVLPSPYRSLVGPLLDFLDQTDREHNDGQLAVVMLPEFVPARWWHFFLHNQSAWLIKTALLYRRRRMGFQRVIIDVPYHLRR
ncbi:APC family permease [Thermanaerothrix sp. 4228-RoL]|uniref:APC family permease n=1 Tax=Thermanaerothrix solaris TaxID=3058434 RepID=A0ABU3NQN2_9CHLR|nr:APC family permease [Thermanaerothrix sp. 4228-RoL]MDT8899145.1 APC family permease [Thermanaerothrix sp. 4228-RoL]